MQAPVPLASKSSPFPAPPALGTAPFKANGQVLSCLEALADMRDVSMRREHET